MQPTFRPRAIGVLTTQEQDVDTTFGRDPKKLIFWHQDAAANRRVDAIRADSQAYWHAIV